MADPVRTSALAGHLQSGRFGTSGEFAPGVVLGERRPAAIVQVNGTPAEDALGAALGVPAPRMRTAFEATGAVWLWTGPGQWLVASERDGPAALRAGVEDALGGTDATVIDLTHGRTVVRVSGANAVDVLLKGCPLDLAAMEAGACATSLLGHLTVTIHCRGGDGFDVYCMRSFGLALWEWLKESAAEYGGEVVAGA